MQPVLPAQRALLAQSVQRAPKDLPDRQVPLALPVPKALLARLVQLVLPVQKAPPVLLRRLFMHNNNFCLVMGLSLLYCGLSLYHRKYVVIILDVIKYALILVGKIEVHRYFPVFMHPNRINQFNHDTAIKGLNVPVL